MIQEALPAALAPVRWGIISTAAIAREKVIPALLASPWCQIQAIGSRTLESAQSCAQRFDIPRAYGSYEAVLDDPDVEAVYVPLPNHLHIDLVLAATARGKHVLCEKPFALTASEVRRLRDVPGHLVVGEAFMVRHHPQWAQLRRMLRSGEHGPVRAVQILLSCTITAPDDIRLNPAAGGGALYDVGSYAVMTARYIYEREPRQVFCTVERDPLGGVDTQASAILDFGDGRQATFTVGLKMAATQRLQIVCERSVLDLPAAYIPTGTNPAGLWIDSQPGVDKSAPAFLPMPVADQYLCEVTHFA
ncbi:Gfo/Idh/MocA family protein [Azotobacter salinestris]|uniref:Gfo/Idh/MocA family protein n=1 Tax=Azotobacter salinestris TaxID=69964 RepID=UPI0032E00DD7